jgi:hypothetical protein
MKNSKTRWPALSALSRAAFLTAAFFVLAAAGKARAEERMNGMVGLFYSSYNLAGFEYDLIAQIKQSKDWMGNISGLYIGDEIYLHANRFEGGFVIGQRADEKGTFAANVGIFGENRFNEFSRLDWGGEAKITLAIFGLKMGIINKKTFFFEVGLSY